MRRVELVPGLPAARWWTIMLIVSSVGILPVLAIAFVITQRTDDSQLVPLMVGACVLAALEYVPVFKMQSARQREAAAGYTSLRWPRNLTLDQVDPATGVVIREGGTPALSNADYRAARAKSQNPLAF